MKSTTLPLYKEWLANNRNRKDVIDFVDRVYEIAENNYERGGDVIVETMEPSEVEDKFSSLEEVKKYCGLHVENATNFRLGEDDDPELERAANFDNWKER